MVAMSKFIPISALKWKDPNYFELNKCNSNSSKGCVLKFDLGHPKELSKFSFGSR